MPTLDESYMREALKEAGVALSLGEVPVGAVIVKDGTIVGRGHNTRETETDISGHAEINAIKDAEAKLGRWSLEGCALYVTLEPCLMCSGAIKQSRISSVVIGAPDEEEGAVVSRYHVFDEDNGKQNIVLGVLGEECAKALKSFFEGIRKK